MRVKYILKCSCGKYETGQLDSRYTAQSAAEMHVMLGPEHLVTCKNDKGQVIFTIDQRLFSQNVEVK